MGLPDKPVKHVPKHQAPIGAKRKGKMKVMDGTTKKVAWRGGKKGFVRDYDGDATSVVYSNKDMKISHKVHGGKQAKEKHDMPKDSREPEASED
jgi:hypothetical protein